MKFTSLYFTAMEVRTKIFFPEHIALVLLSEILMKTLHVRIFWLG